MTTAQTVQLLDANNNNISPAVCIDSIYYEGTVGSNPYRFALREKFVVGGELVNGTSRITSDGELLLPYIFAKQAPGNESVWKLSTGYIDITADVCTFIDRQCDTTYETIDNVSDNCVWRDGSRTMTGNLRMADKLTLSQTGIADTAGDRLTLNNNTAELVGSLKVVINSPKVNIGGTEVSIGDTTSSTTYVYGKHTAMYSQNDLSIGAVLNLHINTSTGNIEIKSNNDIILNANNRAHDISMGARSIYFNSIKFTPPTESDNGHMLAVTQNGSAVEMTWNKIGGMRLLNYHTPNSSAEFSFVETAEHNVLSGACVSFSGGDRHTTIGKEGVPDINIATIGNQTLDGTHDISVMTINGKSVVGTSDVMTFVLDSSFNEYKKNLVHFNGDPNGSNMLFINRNNSDEYVITESSEITVSGGSLQAKAFVMSSDRNLKTDIREDCFAKELPAIHGFKWKDTSVQSYGFIAQELEDAGFDHLVINGRNGKGVDYMAALSYKVAQLERENQMLKQSISDLYDKLNNK